MRQRRLLAYATLAATLATLLIASNPAAAKSPTAPAATGPATRKVTLYTGDQVSVTGGQLAVTPRPGVHFLRFRQDNADYVIPSDAIPLLKADRLDERLFNVTALLDFNFDKLPYLPLVVSDATAVHGLASQRKLGAVDGFATQVPVTDLAKTWQATRTSLTSGKIWLDGIKKSTLDVSVPMIGAPEVWAAGYDGTGTKVAVLDTGIDDSHPDLAGKVIARHNFVPDKETGVDLTGHGTHVASTIAGTGAASGGKYKGVAPGAKLLDAKVCWHANGGGACSDSAILEGMQWAAESGVKIVNMSLGGPDDLGLDPLEQAVNDLSAEYGMLFVCAAGNWGGSTFRVGSPSTADAALSVANFDKAGQLNWSSLQGPRLGDYGVKPDIAAPGTDITAARSPSAVDLPEGQYVTMTGTSMATPHVAGSAALLAEVHPDWTGKQIKEALMASAAPNPAYDVFAQGTGLVNVNRALNQTVTVTPASLSIGVLEWPHTEAPSSRTMTYHNRGSQPVTFDLALDDNAPDGLVSLSAKTVTVPAGGDASVQVIADEKASTNYGFYSGRLVATSGDVKLQTPFSVDLEAPSATLKVSVIDRDGGTPGTVMIRLSNPDPGTYEFHEFYNASASLRVPLNSTWHITAYVLDDDGTATLLTVNKAVITADREVVLDARKARPLDITVPDSKATAYEASAVVNRAADGYPTYDGITGDPSTLLTADVGPTGLPGVITQVQAVFQSPANQKGDAPDVYQTGWRTEGSFITGLVQHVKRSDLATVNVDYAQSATGVAAWRTNSMPESSLAGNYPLSSELPAVATPGHRTEYYDTTVPWRSEVLEKTVADDQPILSLAQTGDPAYRAGRPYQERWNGAALDTTMIPLYPGNPVLTRQDNWIYANVSGASDGNGHIGWLYTMTDNDLALYQGDTLLGEFAGVFATFGSWEVAAAPTTYRMRYAFNLPDPFLLSRRTESEWTFTTSADQQGELPLTSIGFQPDLGPDNTSRAGSVQSIPLTFAQQATAGKVKSATVSVSYDDGATWVAVATTEHDGQFTASVRQPAGTSGFVSLRATAVDTKGNTVTTTVIRAYALK
jgi:subtilisin family serine protease